jgi:uncharacterized protein YkwD
MISIPRVIAPIAATLGARLALAVVLSFMLMAAGLVAPPARTAAWTAGEFSGASEAELLALTNASRTDAGLAPLRADVELTSLARSRSRDMIDRGYFSHDIPGAGSVFDLMTEREYCFDLAGENIGWNTYGDDTATDTIHQMLLDSPGHRANIMGVRWSRIGVGAYKGPDGTKMWTVLFADPCAVRPESATRLE